MKYKILQAKMVRMTTTIEPFRIMHVCTGSLIQIYKRCGNPRCKCQRTKGHGPYFIWTRKVKGKTVTKTLTKLQAKYCREYIKNMNKIKAIIRKMEEKTLRHLVTIKD